MKDREIEPNFKTLKWGDNSVYNGFGCSDERWIPVPATEVRVGDYLDDAKVVARFPFETESHHQKRVKRAYDTLKTRILLRNAGDSDNPDREGWTCALKEELTKPQI